MQVEGSKVKFVARIAGIVVGFSLIGFLLLVISFTLPRGRIIQNVRESAVNYRDYTSWAQGVRGTMADNFSDAIMLNQAAYDQYNNPIEAASLISRYEYEGIDDSMLGFNMHYGTIEPESEEIVANYPRYWHGYLIFLAPLLEIINPAEILYLNATIQLILIVVLIAIAYRRYGIKLAVALGIFVVSLSPLTVALSFQFAANFYATVIALILMLLLDQWLMKKNRYYFMFLLIGCATVFFDLLSYPFITLGVPLALLMYLRNYQIKQPKDIVSPLRTGALTSVLWLVGYGLTWAMKWGIASVILGRNVFADALETVKVRTGGDFGVVQAIGRNIFTMFSAPMIIFFALVIIATIILLFRKKITLRWRKWQLLPYLVICAYPFVWYCALCNHSYIHCWFAYRELSIAIFAIALAAASSITRRQYKITRIRSGGKKKEKK